MFAQLFEAIDIVPILVFLEDQQQHHYIVSTPLLKRFTKATPERIIIYVLMHVYWSLAVGVLYKGLGWSSSHGKWCVWMVSEKKFG
jgi:hypothetical protein